VSHAALVAAIKTRMDTVSGVGIVHNRLRHRVRIQDFIALYANGSADAKKIRAWWIALDNITGSWEVDDFASFGNVSRTYNFRLFGVLGFQDNEETEASMVSVCEAIMDDLDAQTTLGVSGVVVRAVGPCSLVANDIRHFGNNSVLCHVVEITCPVVKVVSV
jgi:hypothetical protein